MLLLLQITVSSPLFEANVTILLPPFAVQFPVGPTSADHSFVNLSAPAPASAKILAGLQDWENSADHLYCGWRPLASASGEAEIRVFGFPRAPSVSQVFLLGHGFSVPKGWYCDNDLR